MPEPRIAIVDPYSSGALLAEALVEHGVGCIAIESSSTLPTAMKSKFDPTHFAAVVPHVQLDTTVALLRSQLITHVIAGFESGVELSDRLSESLELPMNDPASQAARRDKYLMSQAVERMGLRTALQFCSADPDQIVQWARDTLDWPVIVKPPKSVASDGVFRCDSIDQVYQSALVILNKINVLGIKNPAVIIQEFLDGVEYAVDMVSVDGRAKLTAIWQYERPAAEKHFIAYDAMRLLDYEGERQAILRQYATSVLSALGIRFGPSHCELIWQQSSPVLVEVGARMSAGINAVLSRLCGGICQLDETVKSLIAPAEFLATLDARPQLNQYAANIFLRPLRPGKLIRTRHVERLRQLDTFHSLSITTRPDSDVSAVAGRVTLVDADNRAIDKDIQVIRQLQHDGIFEVRNDTTPGMHATLSNQSSDPTMTLSHYPNLQADREHVRRILTLQRTPIFLCKRNNLIDRYQHLAKALETQWGPQYVIAYSFKTNYLVAESRILQELGGWAEVVSEREYRLARELQFAGPNIIYNGPHKPDDSLRLAIADGALINLNDHDELDRLQELSASSERVVDVGIRVSSTLPRLGHSRFGFSLENSEAATAVSKIRESTRLNLVAIHTHLYGDTDDPEIYGLAARRVGEFLRQHVPDYRDCLKYVDMGGGFPAHSPKPKSRKQWSPREIDIYIEHIAANLREYFPDPERQPTLVVEPGRFVTCDGIVLVTQVIHVKQSDNRQVVNCDGSISMVPLTHYCPQIIRPYTPDITLREGSEMPTSIHGSTCRENDLLYDGPFPPVQRGDYLVHYAAGAYNSSLSPDFIFASPPMQVF